MSKTVARIPVWVRAVLVCVAIPALFAVEVWIGMALIRTPQEIFGDVADVPELFGFIPMSAFSVALGLALIWIIVKTPFAVMSFAFSPDGRSPLEKEEVSK